MPFHSSLTVAAYRAHHSGFEVLTQRGRQAPVSLRYSVLLMAGVLRECSSSPRAALRVAGTVDKHWIERIRVVTAVRVAQVYAASANKRGRRPCQRHVVLTVQRYAAVDSEHGARRADGTLP